MFPFLASNPELAGSIQHTLTHFRTFKSKEIKKHSEMPRSLPAATPTKPRGKSKGNRSVRCIPGGNEAIWDDELHTALIEALNIYPPMGRQRIRPMHDGGEGHTSLGRCQLIQQYLIQRTGKNRTRKQISSRIQRLRRMHQDDPAMADILRVLPDVQRPIAPEILVDLNDSGEAATTVAPVVPATPPLLGSVESSACSSPSPHPLGDLHQPGASSSFVQSNQLTLRLFEAADLQVSSSGNSRISSSAPCNEPENISPGLGLCLPSQPVASLSRRQMESTLRFSVDLPSGQQFSFPDPDYGFDTSTQSVEMDSLPLAGNQFSYNSCQDHSADPITPTDQIIHTPEFPPQVFRGDKRPAHQSPCTEKDGVYSQLATCVSSSSPCDPHPGSHLAAAAEYTSSKCPFHTSRAQNYSFPSSPLASFHANVQSATSCLLPLESEGFQNAIQEQDIPHLVHLPRRLSYHYDSELLDSGLYLRMPSVAYPCLPEESNMSNTLGRLELASPAVIRPFFTSDFPYPSSGSSTHHALEEIMAESVHGGSVSL